ncbi:MAG: hypothetical protein HQL87_02495 [Magnetococcales bacterium]|nr:hypothetical protein [Magnetococcales bacterium]
MQATTVRPKTLSRTEILPPEKLIPRSVHLGRERSKAGIIASLMLITLTGFRILRPTMPLHPIAGVVLIGFTLWHLYQKDQRPVHAVPPPRLLRNISPPLVDRQELGWPQQGPV